MTETTGVALVGYGYWGANLARNIEAAESLDLVGIADPDPGQRKTAHQAFPHAESWTELGECLRRPDVEAVVLATPATTHAAMARETLLAGRHVMVEKPLATDPGEAMDVAVLAEDRHLIAMVGHTFLYSPPVNTLRDYIAEGRLGEVQYLYSQRLSLGRIRRDCNALWNFAPHDVSIMMYLLQDRPVEVSARSHSFIDPTVEDVFFASITFAGGVAANLHVSWIDPRKTRLMTVVGDEQMAIYNDVSADQKLWMVDAGVARSEDFGEYQSLGDFQWRTRAGDIVIPHIPLSEPLANEMNAFGEACQTGEPPLTHAQHGAEVVRVLDAIQSSAGRRGAPVGISW